MLSSRRPLVLASASPRRRELLRQLGLDFRVQPAHIDEAALIEARPRERVEMLARLKAEAVQPDDESLVIGADTVVSVGDRILEKPDSRIAAHEMLKLLSGRFHQVWSGLALRDCKDNTVQIGSRSADVRFSTLSDPLLELYLETGEYADKAGAYGIQGAAGCFIEEIRGDYYAVVGLSLIQLREFLAPYLTTS